MKVKCLIVVVAAMATGSLFAESGFSYQGRLVDEGGHAMTNGASVRFSVYKERSGGTALWQKDLSVSPNMNGTFNVELAGVGMKTEGTASIPLSDAISTTDDRYLEITIIGKNSQPNMTVTPRQKILPVPNAIYAQNVREALGDFTVHGMANFYGGLAVYGNKNGADPSMTFGSDGSLVTEGTVVSGNVSAENGSFSNDLTVNGDLKVGGNVTLIPSQEGTVFTATQTTFKVKSLEIVDGGELTVNGINPGVPVGVISIWSGDVGSIPAGWAVCNGDNGTPDLTGRFVVGAGGSVNSSMASDGGPAYSKGSSGGVREVTLTVEQMPRHYHEYFGDDQLDVAASRVRNQPGYDAQSQKTTNFQSAWFKTTESGGNSNGGTSAHENLPPYYALFYIMKIR